MALASHKIPDRFNRYLIGLVRLERVLMKNRLRINKIVLLFLIGLTLVLAFRSWAVSELCRTERTYLGLMTYIPKPVLKLKDSTPYAQFKKALEQWESNPKYKLEIHQFHLELILLIASTAFTIGYTFLLFRRSKHETQVVVESDHERPI